MSNSTEAIYQSVIHDVINKVRQEFFNAGYEESALRELQQVRFAKCNNFSINSKIRSDSSKNNLILRTSIFRFFAIICIVMGCFTILNQKFFRLHF